MQNVIGENMKKLSLLVSAMLFTTTLITSCGTASSLQGPKPVNAISQSVVLDYQGAALGGQLPRWVQVMLLEGGTEKQIQKALDIDSSYKIFPLKKEDKNLELLQLWTDNVDARAEVASSIKQNIGQAVRANLSGAQSADETMLAKTVDLAEKSLTNITISGLSKETSFWVKTATLKPGVKTAKSEADYTDPKYTYLVVFSIPGDLYKTQLEAALNNVSENDDQFKAIREAITSELVK